MPARRTPLHRLRRFFKTVHLGVFGTSMSVIVALVIYGSVWPAHAHGNFQAVNDFITEYFGWYYLLAVTGFLGFALWLMFSRYGGIRLGAAREKPEFGFIAWFSMLFSAGMGIGLVFWSVAEPMYHFGAPPRGDEAETAAAAREAMLFTFFHWGLHAWAIYVIVAGTLAYFAYRFRLPFTIRSIFYPLLGDRIYGPIGHTIDILAIFATLFGLATSLGLGVMQLNTGLNHLTNDRVPVGVFTQVALIAGITAIAVVSVVSGLHRGLKWISIFNLVAVLVLMAFLFLVGPTLFNMRFLVESTGYYLQNVVQLSFWADATGDPPHGFQGAWTVFYWAWWIAWSPFVGIFIARVSRGRTLREFIAGALLMPTMFVFVWLTIFGGTGLHLELAALAEGVEGGAGIAAAVAGDYTRAMWVMLAQLPWAMISSILAAVLIVTYFVTSSDSATYVVDALITRGSKRSPTRQRVIWGVTEGAIAAVLLVAGGMYALAPVPVAEAEPALQAALEADAALEAAAGALEPEFGDAVEAVEAAREALPEAATLAAAIEAGVELDREDQRMVALWEGDEALGDAEAALAAAHELEEDAAFAEAIAALEAVRGAAATAYRERDAALDALQAASIITGLPFSVILVLICVNFVLALRREFDVEDVNPEETPGVTQHSASSAAAAGDDTASNAVAAQP